MKKSEKMRRLMAGASKREMKDLLNFFDKPKEQAIDLDANKDGKVDEKDASLFSKAAKAIKMAVRKKSD